MLAISFHLLVSLCLVCVSEGTEGSDEICDDGEHNIEVDLGGDENSKCAGERFQSPGQFHVPAGLGECGTSQADTHPHCMWEKLHYQQHPPSEGPYRPCAPKFGEYHYLPPQRWLHTLRLGGVAFLYHPCTNQIQVEQLRQVAKSCLNMYVLTPYPHLTKERPLAVVTWTCVYRMSWVNPSEVRNWLLERHINHSAGNDEENCIYQRGLIYPQKTQVFSSLCPTIQDSVSTSSPAEGTPRENELTAATSVGKPTQTVPCQSKNSSSKSSDSERGDSCLEHKAVSRYWKRVGLTALSVLAGVVLLGFLFVMLFKGLSTWNTQRHKRHRYKSVSRYFPFSYGKQKSDVVIPEVGMPKSGSAERQVLLNESDEDEL